MREFLITKFVCAKCGSKLQLNYDFPKNGNRYAKGEPTGADMVEQCIAILPCECTTKPLDDFKKALSILFENKGK